MFLCFGGNLFYPPALPFQRFSVNLFLGPSAKFSFFAFFILLPLFPRPPKKQHA